MGNDSKKAQIEILKGKIENLKARFPAHSVKPQMIQELERLEEELETLLGNDENLLDLQLLDLDGFFGQASIFF